MFRFKKALVAALLTLTLLVAPAALASPDADAPTTWMSWVEDFFSELASLVTWEKSTTSETTDDGSTTTEDPTLTFGSDPVGTNSMTQSDGGGDGSELGVVPEPGG